MRRVYKMVFCHGGERLDVVVAATDVEKAVRLARAADAEKLKGAIIISCEKIIDVEVFE